MVWHSSRDAGVRDGILTCDFFAILKAGRDVVGEIGIDAGDDGD